MNDGIGMAITKTVSRKPTALDVGVCQINTASAANTADYEHKLGFNIN